VFSVRKKCFAVRKKCFAVRKKCFAVRKKLSALMFVSLIRPIPNYKTTESGKYPFLEATYFFLPDKITPRAG
jgi:hypothetical protein